ncbi:hypothetical protein RQP46_009484 [Phenoliferia psychrophenolica]
MVETALAIVPVLGSGPHHIGCPSVRVIRISPGTAITVTPALTPTGPSNANQYQTTAITGFAYKPGTPSAQSESDLGKVAFDAAFDDGQKRVASDTTATTGTTFGAAYSLDTHASATGVFTRGV